jgi:uncharacterized protein
MPRVVHFEISYDDSERAVTFYKGVFGWEIQQWGGPMEYWLVKTAPDGTTAPGINGGMFKRKGPVGYVNTVDVPSVDDFTAKVEAAGGQVVLPKMAVPGVGWLAYCKDTEDNIFGLMQADPSAK